MGRDQTNSLPQVLFSSLTSNLIVEYDISGLVKYFIESKGNMNEL